MSNSQEPRAYVEGQLNRLTEAIADGDSDAAMSVIEEMTADGHGAVADKLMNGLIAIGLRRMATLVENGDTSALSALLPPRPTSHLSALGDQLRAGQAGAGGKKPVVPVDTKKAVVFEDTFGNGVRVSVRDATEESA